jgi:diamine N-acetyltransferase
MIGKNIALRALEPSDIDLLYSLENDSRLWHLSNTITPFSRFVLEQYLVNAHEDIFTSKQLRLVIEAMDTQMPSTPVGLIDLYEFDPIHLRAGVGIMIIEHERGKSYASEALGLLINYCFHTLQLKQLYAGIPADNEASIRLFRNAGFTQTGIRHQWIRQGDSWVDELFFQHIRP